MAYDYDQYLHKEWLGLLQPEGLVVSPPALVDAQAFVDKSRAISLQPVLQAIAKQELLNGKSQTWVPQFETFAAQVLEWESEDFVAQADLPEALSVPLSDYGETLRPDYAVSDPDSDGWLLLIQCVPLAADLDGDDAEESGWKATYQQKFERLLKGLQVPIGVLWNGTSLRLVYAPSGESSGHVTFPIEAMTEVPGRTILGALEMLLGADRLFNAPTDKTLPKLLEASRNYQSNVSTKLAEQVLDALWELLRGFQAADAQRDDRTSTTLSPGVQQLAAEKPQHVYGGLLTTLMRLVFLLYAEDRGLMPDDSVYQRNYSVTGLYEKLRDDAGLYPDTMDQRYGAWAWLLSLFRLVYDGGGATESYLPARHGQLFDPVEYPFLEGQKEDQKGGIPRIADGFIYRMLSNLLMLEGERLSYRTLAVQEIGSVYEAIMGYEVEIARDRSIAVSPKDVVISLDALLAAQPKDRAKVLKDEGELTLSGNALTALKAATTVDELLAALGRRVSDRTQQVLQPGALYLQPGEERRRTGSHYTPKKLTEPIVKTTLAPILEQLGEHPTADRLLDLKVCDLAMGSAAFLVEVCQQLADEVVKAWDFHGSPVDLPDVIEPVAYARRLVTQQCLYGVDKNSFAVNLAKLSLWLVTLAKDLPFTFVDHALKCGDSLVGLTKREIGSFGNKAAYEPTFFAKHKALIQQSFDDALKWRRKIQTADTRSDGDALEKQALLDDVEARLAPARLTARVAVASFFAGGSRKKRKENWETFGGQLIGYEKGLVSDKEVRSLTSKLVSASKEVLPFNWEMEFLEVFDRENSGFDAIVGNPPFLGGKRTSTHYGNDYLDWLIETNPDSHGNTDIVAFFFRRAFSLLRTNGALGLVATNTIAQGDTRATGLMFICQHDGIIYNADKRIKWPGLAAVVISIINIYKGSYSGLKSLEGKQVNSITAFLFHAGGNENPRVLVSNQNKSFLGFKLYGQGFIFDDDDSQASPISEMQSIIEKCNRYSALIFPYIGGAEVNSSPNQSHRRYAINFSDMSEEEARQYPDLISIVEDKVKPQRMLLNRKALGVRWWQYGEKQPSLAKALRGCSRVLVISRVGQYASFVFLPSNLIYSEALVVIPLTTFSTFCILQSNVHGCWAHFFGSSMKDDLRYTPSDCFQTFPFPPNWQTSPTLEAIGQTYYNPRAALMIRNNQGLTDTYNRFHDPAETDPDIHHLRDLHSQMDRAVLDAYDWQDISTTCGFALDYLDTDTTDLPLEAQERIDSGDLFFATAAEATSFDNLIRSSASTRKKKLPWRYRWPESTHDEVLARLLDLNQQRYEEEVKAGLHSKKKGKKKATLKKTTKQVKDSTSQLDLLK